MAILLFKFSNEGDTIFQEGHALFGFDPESEVIDFLSTRSQRLYSAVGIIMENTRYRLGELPDGRWALVGPTEPGWIFAVEEQGLGVRG